MTEGSYRSGAGTQTPVEAHCGQPMIELNEHRACSNCHTLFSLAKGKLRAVDQPDALTMKWHANPVRVVLTRRQWRPEWTFPASLILMGGLMLVLLSSSAAAEAVYYVGRWTLPPAVVVAAGTVAAMLGGIGLATGAGLLAPTTTVSVSPTFFDLHTGPFLWSAPVRVERAHGELVVERIDEHVGARWPAPARYQVRLLSDGRPPVILLDRLASTTAAERARSLLAHVLEAVRPRWRVESTIDQVVDEAAPAPRRSSRASRARRR